MDLYVGIVMDVKQINSYLRDLCLGIAMDVKKTNNYLQDLCVGIAYLKWPYENYNRKDVGIAQCSFWYLKTLDKLILPVHMGLFKFWFLHLKY
jgi:hypothetical protein